jgi:hypothetical protein
MMAVQNGKFTLAIYAGFFYQHRWEHYKDEQKAGEFFPD